MGYVTLGAGGVPGPIVTGATALREKGGKGKIL